VTGCQGEDWASYQSDGPPTAGLAFAFVKATEGTGYTNPRHAAQVATARAAHLVVGHYHFARPGTVSTQVAYFLHQAAPRPGDMLCLDWEDAGVSSGWKDVFIRAVQAAAPGHRVLLYCNSGFWLTRDSSGFAGDGLWIADPDAPMGQPRVKTAWLIHQYSEAGGRDRDYCRLPAADLRAWAAGTTPTPQQEDDMDATQTRQLTELHAALVPHKGWDYSHGDKPDVHQTLVTAAAQATATNIAVKTLTAQIGALTVAVTALSKQGGLTAEQVTAAAQAGAQAALAELGHALDGTQP
jgi:hypothetical protein